MRLVAEWWRVLRYAWSIRLLVLAGLLSGAEIALPLIQDLLPIPRGVFALTVASSEPSIYTLKPVSVVDASDHVKVVVC